MKPEITIIVPVYNTESFLHKCINSILSQSYTNFELLLINDGSSDKSGEICDKFALKDDRIKVFHKKNGGVSSSRNLGINNAQGKWIMFIDSDDEITHNCLELCINKTNKGPVDLIEFGCCYLTENKQKIAFKYKDSERILTKKEFWENCYKNFAICAHLFKKEYIFNYNIRFEENLIMSEDRLFIFKYLYYTNSIATINNCCYLYRQHSTSVCHSPISINKVNSQYQTAQKLIKEYISHHKDELTDNIFTFLATNIIRNYITLSIKYGKDDIQYNLNSLKTEITNNKINIPFLELITNSNLLFKAYIYLIKIKHIFFL